MKKITLYSLVMLLVFFSCKKEEKKAQSLTIGQLTISNEHPVPGDELALTYNSDKDIDAFYSYIVGTKNYPVDIDFTKTGEEHKASITLPDSAVAVAFIIKIDDTYDHNEKKGYVIPLFGKDGNRLPGSNAASSYYSVRQGANYGIKADEKTAASVIEEELEANPELKTEWQGPYLQFEYKNNKENGEKLINEYLGSLSAKTDKSEKDYLSMMNFYKMTNQQDKFDSINKVIIGKFPNSSVAENAFAMEFSKEADVAKKEELFNEYEQTHKELGNLGNYLASSLAMAYFEKDDMDNFEKYSSKIDDGRRASTLNNLAWKMAEKGENLNQAAKLSKTSVDLIENLQKKPEDKPEYYTQKQYKKSLESSYRMYADTYALILFKQGNVKEAIIFQEKAQGPKAQDVEANQRYIEYLMADNQYDKVVNKAETFIKDGYGNANIKEAYKAAYTKVNPSANDVDEKLAAYEKEAYKTQVADIKKTMLDEEAPAFILKDMKGEDVSLESLKGKTVILDFWATWCGPCKASFPGMQEVVTKYKDDDKVALLFVDTFERGANKEQLVEEFIKTNNYDFHVLYDVQIEGSNNFEVAGKYDVSGIPTKVIIGPDGRMKFKSVGYSGSNEKLVKEMDIMIDILKS